MDSLRLILPMLMAVGTSLMLDRQMQVRGLLPPNFRLEDPASDAARRRAPLLRTGALVLVAFVLWLGVFSPLGMLGQSAEAPIAELAIPDLFTLHMIFTLALCFWYLLGFAGSGSAAGAWREQFGLTGHKVARELGIGVVAGIAGWLAVIAILLLVALAVYLVGGEEALPSAPPQIITWVVALPIGVRLALSLSAGVVEETFFRGFLQPRVGIVLSSILFVMAHLSYDQPFLLIGVGLLSVLFALLVRWRRSIWAAIVAHTVFDAVQLLFVIPNAVKMLDEGETGIVAAGLTLLSRI